MTYSNMQEKRNVYMVLVEMRPLGTPKCRWEIDIIYRDTSLRRRQLSLKWFLCVLL
jgi:hypothetical protein